MFSDYEYGMPDPLYGEFTKSLTRELELKNGNIKNCFLFEEVSFRMHKMSKCPVTEVCDQRMRNLTFMSDEPAWLDIGLEESS